MNRLYGFFFLFILYSIVSCQALTLEEPYRNDDEDPVVIKDGLNEDPRYSFSGPYGHSLADWTFGGFTLLADDYVRLTPLSSNKHGFLRANHPLPFTSWLIDFKIRISGGRLGGDGLALWLTKQPIDEGKLLGGPSSFDGLSVSFDTFDNDHDGNQPHILLLQNDGRQALTALHDGVDTALAGCATQFRNKRTPVAASLLYRAGKLKLFIRTKTIGPMSLCFSHDIDVPAGLYLAFTASTGDIYDKHDVVSAAVYNLAPGAEDQAVLARIHSDPQNHIAQQQQQQQQRVPPSDHQDDAGAPPHSHMPVKEGSGGLFSGRENDDDAGAPPHKHVGEGAPFVQGEGEGIASKQLGKSFSDEDMVFFKWKKRFEKTRAKFLEVARHEDHEDEEHEFQMPESMKEEPMLDDYSSPDDIATMYAILAEDLWNIKTMQHDTMKMIAGLDELFRHQFNHNDEQHRVFAEGFEKLLGEVATRHTVQDALKEQLLRFEYQKNDLHALSTDFASNMKVLRTEFDSVSNTVRTKVGAGQEILNQQLKDMSKQLENFGHEMQAILGKSVKEISRSVGPQGYTQVTAESGDYSWAFYIFIGFQFIFLICFYFIRVKTHRNRHILG